MITFTSLASSSKGNAYLVKADSAGYLLIEAGLPIKILREKMNFNLFNLDGCLISHEHMDHAKAVKDLLKMGVDCFMSPGTSDALGITGHHRINAVYAGMQHTIGKWTVHPFPLEHDAKMPLGFLIAHDTDRLLFVPDTGYVHNRFEGVTILAIEANHAEDLLSESIQHNEIAAMVGRRIRRTHMSLGVLKEFIKANNMKSVREVWLLHLSDSNSNEVRFKREIQELLGVPVYIA